MSRSIIMLLLLMGLFIPTDVDAQDLKEQTGKHVVDVTEFGAAGDGRSDDTEAIQEALTQLDERGGGSLYFPSGTYNIYGSLSVQLNHDLNIVAEEDVILDGTASAERTLIRLGGYQKEAQPLLEDADKGTTEIMTNLDVSAGDYVLITSTAKFNLSRDYYIDGELAKVREVNGKTITLTEPLYTAYNPYETQIISLQMPKITIDGLQIIRDSNDAGLLIEYAHDIELRNISAQGARDRNIAVYYTYGGIIEGNNSTDCFYDGSGTSYGLVLASAVRDVTVQNNELTCGNHGMTLGGKEPVRDVLIQNNVFDSYRGEETGYIGSFNTHSNVENITIQNNIMRTGASIGGRSLTFRNNEVYHFNRDDAALFVKLIQDMDELVIEDNRLQSDNGYGIRLEGYMKDTVVKNIRINRNNIQAEQSGIWMKPRTENDTNIHIQQLEFQDNRVEANEGIALALRTMADTRLKVDKLDITGGYYHSNLDKAFYTYTDGDTDITVDGTTFEIGNFGAGIQLLQGGDVNVRHARFTGLHEKGGWTNSFLNLQSLNIEGSTFDRWSTISGVDVKSVRTKELLIHHNQFLNTPARRVFAPKSAAFKKENGAVTLDWETYVDSYQYLVKRNGEIIGKHLNERKLEDMLTNNMQATYEIFAIDPKYGIDRKSVV